MVRSGPRVNRLRAAEGTAVNRFRAMSTVLNESGGPKSTKADNICKDRRFRLRNTISYCPAHQVINANTLSYSHSHSRHSTSPWRRSRSTSSSAPPPPPPPRPLNAAPAPAAPRRRLRQPSGAAVRHAPSGVAASAALAATAALAARRPAAPPPALAAEAAAVPVAPTPPGNVPRWGTRSYVRERFFEPGLTPEEAAARIRQTAEGMRTLRPMLETMSWKYVLFYVRLKSKYLDLDLTTAMAGVPEARRPDYVRVANELVDNMTEFDYFVRTPKVYESYLYYEKTLKSLDDVAEFLA
ncbi:hypothetical protein EJB05_21117, partial [Eragrostis curvula]